MTNAELAAKILTHITKYRTTTRESLVTATGAGFDATYAMLQTLESAGIIHRSGITYSAVNIDHLHGW